MMKNTNYRPALAADARGARVLAATLTVAAPVALAILLLIAPASDAVVAVPAACIGLAALMWTMVFALHMERRR